MTKVVIGLYMWVAACVRMNILAYVARVSEA